MELYPIVKKSEMHFEEIKLNLYSMEKCLYNINKSQNWLTKRTELPLQKGFWDEEMLLQK